MPIYEYKCDTCGDEVEKLVKRKAPPPACACGIPAMRKKVSRVSFALKGKGWARDGYSKDKPRDIVRMPLGGGAPRAARAVGPNNSGHFTPGRAPAGFTDGMKQIPVTNASG